MGVFAQNIQGQEGRVTLPMGALIGYFSHWSLSSPDKQTYTLSATFGYVNDRLWSYADKEGMERRITLSIGKEKKYQLKQEDGAKVELNPATKQLVMEKVTLCLPDAR